MAARHFIHNGLVCLTLLFNALNSTAAAPTSSTNITSQTGSRFRDEFDDIASGYCISGTYGAPFPLHYYTGLFTTIFSRQHDRLVGGMLPRLSFTPAQPESGPGHRLQFWRWV